MDFKTVAPADGQSYGDWKQSFSTHVVDHPGIYLLDERHYHDSFGMGQSSLKEILKSPKHFKHRQENPIEQSAAMEFGSAVHKLFFEPKVFTNYFFDTGSVTKQSKTKWAQLIEDNPGKTPLKGAIMDSVRSCVKSIRSHELAMSFLDPNEEDTFVELAAYGFIDDRLLSRGKIDAMKPKRKMISDLKTTRDVTPHSFQTSVHNFKYDFQSAYYLDLFSKVTNIKFEVFAFVCVESAPPYDIQCYVADPSMIARGREDYRHAIDKYVECTASNSWPGYEQKVLNLTLPAWA